MTAAIRDLRPGDLSDAESVVRVRRAALPFVISTVEGVSYEPSCAHPASHHRVLVAETPDGGFAGTAETGIAHDSPQPGQGYVNAYAEPARRGAETRCTKRLTKQPAKELETA
ncbi:hypothetical protein ACFVFI_22830 [Streptomyces sp. NPDC057705]|uniref:hypothetical protein n=1 Tax=Streptomyces sp. NPDC057705 TaxID=3346222 RepID=UPI0036B44F73